MSENTNDKATLTLDGRTVELNVLEGTMGGRVLDLSRIRAQTGCFAFDPALVNTVSCRSAITYVDGEKGELLLRGYPIEELTEHCSFIEVAYLLIHGALPTEEQRRMFSRLLNQHSMLHEDMRSFFGNYPEGAHPMAVLSAMVVSLSSFYPAVPLDSDQEEIDITVTRLLSKLRTIAAFSYKKSIGEPYVYPSHKHSYCENFMNMMFQSPVSLSSGTASEILRSAVLTLSTLTAMDAPGLRLSSWSEREDLEMREMGSRPVTPGSREIK